MHEMKRLLLLILICWGFTILKGKKKVCNFLGLEEAEY